MKARLERLVEDLVVDLEVVGEALPDDVVNHLIDAPKPRTALYQPWLASMDEGWTGLKTTFT